jgi:hypothetical protein
VDRRTIADDCFANDRLCLLLRQRIASRPPPERGVSTTACHPRPSSRSTGSISRSCSAWWPGRILRRFHRYDGPTTHMEGSPSSTATQTPCRTRAYSPLRSQAKRKASWRATAWAGQARSPSLAQRRPQAETQVIVVTEARFHWEMGPCFRREFSHFQD